MNIDNQKNGNNQLNSIRNEINEIFCSESLSSIIVGDVIKSIEKNLVRNELLKSGKRIDGRDTKTVRPIELSLIHI